MKESSAHYHDQVAVEFGADMLGSSRKVGSTRRRNSNLLVKSKKSRLDDTLGEYSRLEKVSSKKKDDDWFLLQELVEESKSKKLSVRTVLQLVSLIFILMALVCTLSVSRLKKLTLWDLPLWKWEILLSVILSGHLLCGWGARVVVFCLERGFLKKLRVLYFVYELDIAFQHCLWIVVIVIAWYFMVAEKMYHEKHNKVLHYLRKGLLCVLVASLIWFIKVIIVKILASSFHDNKFFKRINEYLIKQYVIKRLVVYLRGGYNTTSSSNCLHEWTRIHMSNIRNKSLTKLVHGGLIPTLSTMDEDLSDLSDEEDEESSRTYAEKLARKIFKKVAKEPGCIRLEDLKCFPGHEKALKRIDLFEGTEEEARIDQQSFIDWMVEAFKERRYILMSLNDAKTAVEEVHCLMNVLVSLLILILWLFLFELPIGHLLVLVSAQLFVLTFVFGNTSRTVFEAIIFLFIMHPFDVGDRCEIDGVQMVVEEVNIMTTVFERYDFQKVTYPNCILATKPIGNYNRSANMGDQIEFSIHISTPGGKIVTMKDKIKSYIESHDKYWHSKPLIIVKEVQDMNRLVMTVWPRHKMNHQDMLQRWTRRSSLIDGMIDIFRELNIEYRMLPLEVNVRNLPGTTPGRLASNWST